MKVIRRHETTQQAFDFDVKPENIKTLLVTYTQNGEIVSEKIYEKDGTQELTISELAGGDECGMMYRATFSFTAVETAAFEANSNASVQMRIETTATAGSQSLISDIWDIEIMDALNNEEPLDKVPAEPDEQEE